MHVKKAIIPAAGLGTRFLPATKAQPKEMLPIVDKPTIQYIIEEAIESGIEDIIVVTGRGKRAIEDHFDKSFELEETLEKKNKSKLLEEVKAISSMTNIHYIRQKEANGLGHAIWCARKFIGNEPFAVLLGDDIVQSDVPCLKQLIDVFDRYHSSVVGVQEVPNEDVSKYGIVSPKGSEIEANVIHAAGFVEKPKLEEAPSNYAIMGRYVLRPEIFDILENLPPGAGGEIQLTDAIKVLNESQVVLAYNFDGVRYDVGDKFGFIKATIDLALQRDDLSEDVAQYIKDIYEKQVGQLKQ
ncbi:UTP--glucose-1-phosphate uridylyltransferase GalU [Halalkalibacterium halodurans]|jgi:UTP--glucose-1-phosphate uridylyltransferase|uniref:UTP--glucose-1-phosphate uridylyltransferase n=1 Tax=Halalkalibacterium halodurans (strain ATCC BAA-125 / DSM 18197 / FERM 7344 / JCM 9153 / C-125) TaxID=272558 RepID=Q9K6S4_HALH5|nr:UTP--glucose-1-phosphate uridylyltransferase GalU [Halalkalibacterium halodurans]MDY7224126.1 UTP--glucose-1-phosphate uridylyltransferase GalU [Halalkalibacterium halodurans]MDY7243411.1 UTP--glucose-1-phosphate uridylyltransferase GalU [Halalkalibacterium halodurans]MED3645250.1 UTP--glucose-1-phosphate uridylyltransferase GalU [Halalkalibacterium halodurans]MED4081960.1 UTP--glucose-1-phosphate uridylyltransferase GalU [Halalkalibacterium halodurans]MED4083659.1 UTP--glucose-1-phosphate 